MTFTTYGALIGLAIAIILIIKKVHPAYSLILGALLGGLIGGGGLDTTVSTMISGAQGMMSSILRILTSGILAGALIKTGSAEKIADVIVKKLGRNCCNDYLCCRCFRRYLCYHGCPNCNGNRQKGWLQQAFYLTCNDWWWKGWKYHFSKSKYDCNC